MPVVSTDLVGTFKMSFPSFRRLFDYFEAEFRFSVYLGSISQALHNLQYQDNPSRLKKTQFFRALWFRNRFWAKTTNLSKFLKASSVNLLESLIFLWRLLFWGFPIRFLDITSSYSRLWRYYKNRDHIITAKVQPKK